MNNHASNWWHSIIFLGFLVLLLMLCTFWGFFVNPVKAYAIQRRALNTNHEAVLAACREMLVNRDKYRNDWDGNPTLLEGDKALDSRKGITPDVPKPIRELKPDCIIIRKDKVEIRLAGPYLQYIIGFKEGVPGQGDKMLTNGLWYARY